MLPTKTFEGLTKDKQKKIYNSAIKEFAEKGYSQASTTNICKEANISKGSIFQYFQTKTALFFFVVKNALREVIDHYKFDYEINAENLSLQEIFSRSCRSLFEIYENYPYHYRLYQRINHEDDAPNYQEIRRYLARFVSQVTTRFISVGKRRKLIREDIPPEMMKFIVENFLIRFIEEFSENVTPDTDGPQHSEEFLAHRGELIEQVFTILTEGISRKN